jgi:hypothetical protein
VSVLIVQSFSEYVADIGRHGLKGHLLGLLSLISVALPYLHTLNDERM